MNTIEALEYCGYIKGIDVIKSDINDTEFLIAITRINPVNPEDKALFTESEPELPRIQAYILDALSSVSPDRWLDLGLDVSFMPGSNNTPVQRFCFGSAKRPITLIKEEIRRISRHRAGICYYTVYKKHINGEIKIPTMLNSALTTSDLRDR